MEELSTWITEIAMNQSVMHSEIRAGTEMNQRFQGWMVSVVRGITTHTGIDPSTLP